MIVNDRITDYLHSLESSQGVLLDTIEKAALDGRVPIIRRETASLLRTLVAALKPSQILEIGTAVGYSALLMCQTMPRACHITTIEKYEKRIPVARENFKRPVRKAGSPCWREMRTSSLASWKKAGLTWCSWMRPRASICTGCPFC